MRRTLLLALLLLGMAASIHAADTKSVLPLAVGNRWEYSIYMVGVTSVGEGEDSQSAYTEGDGSCTEEVTAVNERRKNGDVVYEMRSTTNAAYETGADPKETITDTRLLASKAGIFMLASKANGLNGILTDEWQEYDPPLVLYGSDVKPGKKWKVGTIRDGGLTLPTQVSVAGKETVTVPAGTFKDCLKLHVICNKVAGSMGEGDDKVIIKSGKSLNTVWIYPGVGTVKEDTILQAKMLFPATDTRPELLMTGTQRKIRELQSRYKVD